MKWFLRFKQRKPQGLVGSRVPIQAGPQNGTNAHLRLGIDAFVNEEGGYTSLAVALSLLLSLSLAFSLTSGAWAQNRSADAQSIADAAALSGSNVVGSYMTLATTLDACVLTMGLAGVVTLGAGLIVSAIPGLSGPGAQTIQAGAKILSARQKFATSAAEGLQKLEATLPLIIVARSGATVSANSSGSVSYVGCAIPYPIASKSDFSSLDDEINSSEIEKIAEDIQAKSDRVKELQDGMKAAELEGWLADCGDSPRNAYERSRSLAGLSGSKNPYVASADDWDFGIALKRAQAYYRARFYAEQPSAYGSQKLKTDSVVRRYFFQYAQAQLDKGVYEEHIDGGVTMNLPRLPYNSAGLKATPLYSEYLFPYSSTTSGAQIHGTDECASKHGGVAGYMTLAAFDGNSAPACSECQFYTLSMANVSSASTNIDNGFEHYWRRICDAADKYKAAADELVIVKCELKELTEKSADLFNKALEVLAVPRPKLCPPGAYGCVAAVWRGSEITAPESLATSFTGTLSVGAGGAISAAALAPDNNSDSNDVLTRFFGQISYELTGSSAGVLGDVGSLWSGILNAYANAYNGISSATDSVLSKIDGIPGSSAASWLCSKVSDLVSAAGFEPADLRLFKPVLTNSQHVLDKAGVGNGATARQIVELLGQCEDPATLAHSLGLELQSQLEGQTFTLAEVPIPGTSISFPITVDMGELAGVLIS